MYQKFFTNTLGSKFIKNLLYSTPLPIYRTITDGDYMVEGLYYIYKTSLIKCTRSGTIYNQDAQDRRASDTVVVGQQMYVGPGSGYGDYDVIQQYIFGNEYFQVTETYCSKYRYYDSETHVYLGKYLRCIRDIYGIDLMPFYNCFNYETIQTLHLTTEYEKFPNGYDLTADSKYKIIAIPIKFNEKYTIALDCTTPVLIKSVLYGPYGLIKNNGLDSYVSDELMETFDTQVIHKKLHRYGRLDFKKPVIYTIANTYEDAKARLIASGLTNPTNEQIIKDLQTIQQLEKYLTLLIQVPATNSSSIVVVEGDYADHELIIGKYEEDEDPNVLNKNLISNLGLLQMNTRSMYAFSDRLVEYLIGNVITYQDGIEQNTIRAKDYRNYISEDPSVFDVAFRNSLFIDYMKDSKTRKIDINGFVDKDMEKFITRGIDV